MTAIPLLRIFDYAKAREFYVDWLGFRVDWKHRFAPGIPLYVQVSREGMRLHLTEHHGDCSPGAKVFVDSQGLPAYHRDLLENKYAFNRPALEVSEWNSLTMEVPDPFGNRLLFNQYHDSE